MANPTGATGAHIYHKNKPMTTRDRLESFKELKDGWTPDLSSVAPDHAGMDWLADVFEKNYPDDAPTPYTFPTGDGSIVLEWKVGEVDADLEVNLQARTGMWHVYRPGRKNTWREGLVMDRQFWPWLVKQVKALGGKQSPESATA